MTEKRFIIDRFDLLEYGEPVTVEEACDLLNQLNNENEQLKQSNSQLARVNREGVKKIQKLTKENEQLKKDRFICLDCEHSGYTEIGCLCEYDDHWVEFMSECEDFKELKE